MRDKKHLAVGKRGISLTALALVACMLLAPAGAEIGRARAVEIDQECSLTVTPGNYEDLADAGVVIDLYKVADAKAAPGYDAYTFQFTGAYAGLDSVKAVGDMTKITNEDYQAIAQEAASLTLASEGVSVAKAVDGQPSGSPITETSGGRLASGLYLLIARGGDLTDKDDYIRHISTEEEGKAGTKLATIAHSDKYTYTFEPQLIALPGRTVLNADGTVQSNETSNNEVPWQYDLAVTLKPEQTLRFGILEIVKNLQAYEAGGTTVFVFRVDAYKDETKTNLLYSGVHPVTFSGAGAQSIRVEDLIPAGAYVEVTEDYPGPDYRLQGDAVQTAVIPAPDNGDYASVTYTNAYVGTVTYGGAVTNHFEYNADGGEAGWNWTQQ